MKKALLILFSLALFAGMASASVTYSVAVSFLGNTPGPGPATTQVNSDTSSGQLDLEFVATPGGTVGDGTNTTWGNLFLSLVTPGVDDFANIDGLTLNILLTDVTTGATVLEVGTFSGDFTDVDGASLDSTLKITWAPQGTQTATGGAPASTVTFTTDDSDPVGDNLFPSNAATVNGVVSEVQQGSVPEPATLAMVGAALVGLGFVARKRRV
jgi:PEP-CTERM motif